MTRLEIFTLGPLRLRIDGETRSLGTKKQRALLALLVVNRRRTVSTDRIIVALWGADAPPSRRENVWVYVSRVRKSLGPCAHAIRREASGYVLDVDDGDVDSDRFEALMEEGTLLLKDDPAAASLVLGEALAAWSGRAYEEFENEEFLSSEIARLEESRLSAIEARIQADLAWRDTELVIPEIEGLTVEHPLRASLTESLMVALHRRGRQAEALRAYDRYAAHLADQVGLEPPSDLRALEEQILMDNRTSQPAAAPLHTGLPERIAKFVGRRDELHEVTRTIADHRLVTITGPGGIGKSALALEAARLLVLDHDDIAVVDVARSEQSGDVASVVAEALRVAGSHRDTLDAILTRLASRTVLLIFDNCEPVTSRAAETIVSLLRSSARLRIITTSRVVLGIPGEEIVRLAPLSTKEGGEAEQLLIERIVAVGSQTLEAIEPEDLHTLCIRTEGLPLSIELAAAQLATWSAGEVITALDEPLDTLADLGRVGPSHHREMRTTIAWSERLLPSAANVLLRRLSVLRSDFSFGAVSPIVGFEPLDDRTVKKEFHRLVNASMVLARPGSTKRYYLLDPVREYAATRLHEFGESAAVSENHARYFADRFATLGHAINFGTDLESLRSAQFDSRDVIAAITWMIAEGRTVAGQRFATAAIPLWRAKANIPDVLPILDALLVPPGPASKTRAELLFMAGPLYELARGTEARRERFADLNAIARELDDPEIDAWLELRSADAASSHAAPQQVIALYRQAARSLHDIGSAYEFNALHQLGWYQFRSWDHMDEAEVTVAAWSAVCKSLGSRSPEPAVLGAWIALTRGDTETADRAFGRVSAEYRLQDDHRSAALQMGPRAIASLRMGDAAEAGRRADVSVDATREAGAIPWLLNALATRSYVRVALGDHRGAVEDLLEVGGATDATTSSELAAALAHATATALAASQPERSVALLSAASALPAEDLVMRLPQLLAAPALEVLIGGTEAALARTVDTDTFDAAWSRGSAMDASTTAALAKQALDDAMAAIS